MGDEKNPGKGTFGPQGLPLADQYVRPSARNRPLLIGFAIALVAVTLLTADILVRQGRLFSGGEVFSGHAEFENECSSCHTSFATVSDDKCLECHQENTSAEAFSWAAHYQYRSRDESRSGDPANERRCADCHQEHRGRQVRLVDVGDAQCLACHEFGSFNLEHPEFSAVSAGTETARLNFGHIRHVNRVLEELQGGQLEDSCLYCHVPDSESGRFQSLDFDRHCAHCHLGLKDRKRTPNLPILDGGIVEQEDGEVRLRLGVETIEMVKSRQGPGDRWALEANPREFGKVERRVMKRRVFHRDPWVLHNLRLLRRALYPDAELADLLRSSAVSNDQRGVLQREALETLEDFVRGLRSSEQGWVQAELDRIEPMISDLKERLEEAEIPLEDSRFLDDLALDSRLSEEQLKELNEFALRIAEPCVACHPIEQGWPARVQKDQRALKRAEFDHRPHRLQNQCTDCHSSIPFSDFQSDDTAVTDELDNAAILNLPSIRKCRDCHNSQKVFNQCASCHVFHPEKKPSRIRLADE